MQNFEKVAQDWCARRKDIPYIETSAKEDYNVDDAFISNARITLAYNNKHEGDNTWLPNHETPSFCDLQRISESMSGGGAGQRWMFLLTIHTGPASMDPYTFLTYQTQKKKSSVASGKGSDPEWNKTFLFTVSDVSELKVKIMDSNGIGNDDHVGEENYPT